LGFKKSRVWEVVPRREKKWLHAKTKEKFHTQARKEIKRRHRVSKNRQSTFHNVGFWGIVIFLRGFCRSFFGFCVSGFCVFVGLEISLAKIKRREKQEEEAKSFHIEIFLVMGKSRNRRK
jgi:hypothetical protein